MLAFDRVPVYRYGQESLAGRYGRVHSVSLAGVNQVSSGRLVGLGFVRDFWFTRLFGEV